MMPKTTVRGYSLVLTMLLACGLAYLPPAAAQSEQSVADRQSVDAFISIEDGQPGDPGTWELALEFAWKEIRVREPVETPSAESETRVVFDDIVEGEWELKYTGKGTPFRENMKLSIVQAAELSDFDADGNGDIELNWQQRWHEESAKVPTLATLLGLRLPTGRGSTGFDLTLTGILDKDLGPGTMYVSASGTVPFDNSDPSLRDFLWGAQAGYKWRISSSLSLYANYVIQSSTERGKNESNILEFAAQFDVGDQFTLGPGILVGLDNRDETPEFGAGLKVTIGL